MLISGLIWLVSNTLASLNSTFAWMIFWNKVQYLGIGTIPVAWLLLAWEYSGLGYLVTLRRVLLLSIVPFIGLILVFTNEYHHLFWSESWVEFVDGYALMKHRTGVGLWGFVIYAFALGLIGNALIVRVYLKSRRFYMRQSLMLFATVILILAAAGTELANFSIMPGIDTTPVMLLLLGLIVTALLARIRREDIMPVARERIFENMADAVIVLDSQYRILDMNHTAEKLVGCSANQVLYRSITESWADWSQFLSLETGDMEVNGVTLQVDGVHRVYDARMSPLKEPNGKVISQVIVLRDSTEQRLAEQQRLELMLAQKRTELLSSFITDASHEFRTPLTIINTRLFMLKKMYGDDSAVYYSDAIQEQVNYLSDLVDAMLTSVRLDNMTDIDFVPLDIHSLLCEIVHVKRAKRIAHKRLTVELALCSEPLVICGDVKELQRALTILVDNATLYTPEQGEISISGSSNQAHVEIAIQDTGAGIDEQDIPRVFQPFFRADTARSTRGAGLGLTIAQKIIEAHHGMILLESVVGQGSTFTVRLPSHDCSQLVDTDT